MTDTGVKDEDREALRRRLREKIKGKRNKEEGPQLARRMMDDPTTMMLSLGIEDADILGRAKSIVNNPKGALQDILGQDAPDILPKARRRRKPNRKRRSSQVEAPDKDGSDEEEAPPPFVEYETSCTTTIAKAMPESDDEEAPPP